MMNDKAKRSVYNMKPSDVKVLDTKNGSFYLVVLMDDQLVYDQYADYLWCRQKTIKDAKKHFIDKLLCAKSIKGVKL